MNIDVEDQDLAEVDGWVQTKHDGSDQGLLDVRERGLTAFCRPAPELASSHVFVCREPSASGAGRVFFADTASVIPGVRAWPATSRVLALGALDAARCTMLGIEETQHQCRKLGDVLRWSYPLRHDLLGAVTPPSIGEVERLSDESVWRDWRRHVGVV